MPKRKLSSLYDKISFIPYMPVPDSIDVTKLPIVRYRGSTGRIHTYYLHGYEGSMARLQRTTHRTTFLGFASRLIFDDADL